MSASEPCLACGQILRGKPCDPHCRIRSRSGFPLQSGEYRQKFPLYHTHKICVPFAPHLHHTQFAAEPPQLIERNAAGSDPNSRCCISIASEEFPAFFGARVSSLLARMPTSLLIRNAQAGSADPRARHRGRLSECCLQAL